VFRYKRLTVPSIGTGVLFENGQILYAYDIEFRNDLQLIYTMPGEGQEKPSPEQYPIITIPEWTGHRDRWDIVMRRSDGTPITIPPDDLEHIVEHFLGETFRSPIASPFGEKSAEMNDVPTKARFINEGNYNAVLLLEAIDPNDVKNGDNRAIMIIAKDLESGNVQTARDHKNLPVLKNALPPDSLVAVPKIYGNLLQMEVPRGSSIYPESRKVNAFMAEFLDGYSELSCTYIGDEPGIRFMTNRADAGLNREYLQRGLETIGLSNELVIRGLARSQTEVYLALGKTQKEFTINSGDYVIRPNTDKSLAFGLITLRGELVEKTCSQHITELLTHTENGFHTIFGRQEDTIMPFATYPYETLQGIKDAYTALAGKTKTQVPPFMDTLQQVKEEITNLDFPIDFVKNRERIMEAIDRVIVESQAEEK
jgi:hypothetical protein